MTKRKPRRKTALLEARRKCTDKQRLFSEYYAECLNGTQSARLAGYKGSDTTLAVVASENLRKPNVRDYIDELLKVRKLSAPEVMARISEHATGNMEYFLETDDLEGLNTINLAKARRAGKLHLLKSVKVTKSLQGGSVSIELYSAQAALDKLAKVHGLYQERVDLTSGGEPFDIDGWKRDRTQRLKEFAKEAEGETDNT